MTRQGFRIALLSAIALLLPTTETHAADLNADRCSWSTSVVIGSAIERQSYRDAAGKIRTRVEFQVEMVVYGTTSGVLTLRIRGGEVDGVRARDSDYPELGLQDHYLLFLRSEPGYEFPKFIDSYSVKPGTTFPPEAELQKTWSDACAAHPEGLPAGSLTRSAFESMAHGQAPMHPATPSAGSPPPVAPGPPPQSIQELFHLLR